jgi:hypothetical protein
VSHPRSTVDCARCGRTRTHRGRGLCGSCHVITGLDGTRERYPRRRRRDTDTLEDYRFLTDQGCGEQEVVQRLGIRIDDPRRLVRKASQA